MASAGAVSSKAARKLHALLSRHIDFVKGEVKIETRVDAYGEEDVTKTVAGMRIIPLAQPLVLMLKEWKLRTKREKPDELVFPNKRGWYTGHNNMIKRKFLPCSISSRRSTGRTRSSIRNPLLVSIGMRCDTLPYHAGSRPA